MTCFYDYPGEGREGKGVMMETYLLIYSGINSSHHLVKVSSPMLFYFACFVLEHFQELFDCCD